MPKEMRPDEGGQMLFELSEQAYRKSIELKPNDADWHAGFAELYYLRHNTSRWENPDDYSYALKAVELLQRAYEINPRSTKALELLEYFEGDEFVARDGEAYDFTLLTATPTSQNAATTDATLSPTPEQLGSSIQTQVAVAAQATAHTPTTTAEVREQPTVLPATETQAVVAASPTTTAPDENGSGLLGLCIPGMLVLPLAGVMFSRKRWGRGVSVR